jgi:hypothetical protein
MMKTIRSRLSLAVTLALAAAGAAPRADAQRREIPAGVRAYVAVDAPVVALAHVRLVDGTGAPARDDQAVIVSEGRIQAVGPSASTPVPAGARVMDLSGNTAIPGLVQLHEHSPNQLVNRHLTALLVAPSPGLHMFYLFANTAWSFHGCEIRKI